MNRIRHWVWMPAAAAFATGSLLVLAHASPAITAGSAPAVALASGPLQLTALQPVMTCASLLRTDVSGVVGAPTRITRVAVVGGTAGKPYCEVRGVIQPAIKFEVRLPTRGWTQRYLQAGCGGLCGTLGIHAPHADSCAPVTDGQIALASTDMGHKARGMSGAWAVEHPEAKVDFAYRGVHLTALAAKALIRWFYGRPPRFSYFGGCSDGGREGLMEAQRYPDDFDGIAVGDPALDFTVQNSFYHGWNAVSNTGPDGRAILTADKLPILHAAALAACDADEGLRDGIISEPWKCHFNPAVVGCRPGQRPRTCLTAAQVTVAREIYKGAHDRQGRMLVIGGPLAGSELAWAGVYVPRAPGQPLFSRAIAVGSVKYLYYQHELPAGWGLRDLKFDAATLRSFKLRGLYDATDPDLSRFRAHGGKLVMYHGWADQHISPLYSVAYYLAVEKLFGTQATRAFARLFMVPGMYHCSGGTGPYRFDMLTPLMAWVERGQAPANIVAGQPALAGRNGMPPGPARSQPVLRTRPLYPYPEIAVYNGRGSPNDAANFRPATPKHQLKLPNWLGQGFYISGDELWCKGAGRVLKCVRHAPGA